MIFGNCASLLCCLLLANCAIANINAIFFEEIFEYLLDGMDDSDESSSSEELTNSNFNVTCKNCTLTVECSNCTHSNKIIQSTTPMQLVNSQQITEISSSTPTPTPTIPAPERVVEIMTNNIPQLPNIPIMSNTATASENIVTTVSPQSLDGQQPEKTNKAEEQPPLSTSSADTASENRKDDG